MDRTELVRTRQICLALPEVTERLSHGSPTWFAGKKTIVMFLDDHHGDGRLALWVAAPPGPKGVVRVPSRVEGYKAVRTAPRSRRGRLGRSTPLG